MIVPVDIAEVHEIMPETFAQQVMIVCETQMHRAPYLFEDEGWEKSRLKAAVALVIAGKVCPTSHGWDVKGSATVYSIPAETMLCPCQAARHGKTTVCKHRVAVELYRRVQQAYPLPLPLGPVTVDERLALGRMHDATALSTHHTPQEDRMPDADDDYTPAPQAAVLEPPAALPGPVLLPSLDARTLELSMQAWSAQRQVVKRFLQQELVEGTDYYTLRISGKATKPALSKAGSEKFMALFQLHATFSQDSATWTMLGQPQGTLCYVCTLHTRGGELIGEGRGARKLQQDNGDINKAVKMAQKSAMVDAILRTGALSDVFTQDLTEEDAPTPTSNSAQLRQTIWKLVKEADATITTRDACEAYVRRVTGLTLDPDQYAAIVEALGKRSAS